jgi:hypothetical protein
MLYSEHYYIHRFYLAVATVYICRYLHVCVLFVFSNCYVLYTLFNRCCCCCYEPKPAPQQRSWVKMSKHSRIRRQLHITRGRRILKILKFAYIVIWWEPFLCICHPDWLPVTRLEAIKEDNTQTWMSNCVLVDSYKMSQGYSAYILRYKWRWLY